MQIPLIGNTITEKKWLVIALFRPSYKWLKLTWTFSVSTPLLQMKESEQILEEMEGRIFPFASFGKQSRKVVYQRREESRGEGLEDAWLNG